MNFSVSLIALVALQTASAFTPSVPGPKFGTRVFSSIGTDVGYSPDVAVSGSGDLSSYSRPPAPRGEISPLKDAAEVFESAPTVTVQGNTLRTCSFDSSVERVQVCLRTEGRPLTANVELWQGPDNTPQKIGVYLEDGADRPFSSIIETPSGTNSIAIRNTGMMEFPLSAAIEPTESMSGMGSESPAMALARNSKPKTVQGGAVYTVPFSPAVASVQVVLRTDGRPLNARVELLQGPNNNKQVLELYSEDGRLRPFFATVETPGSGNVVRIVNTSTVEFPLSAHCEPFMVDPRYEDGSGYQASGVQWSD